MTRNLMKLYDSKMLLYEKKYKNDRLRLARRYVEGFFGITGNKWRILYRPLNVKIEFEEDTIIKAMCVLHNYVRMRNGFIYEDTLYAAPLLNLNPPYIGHGE